MPSTSPYAEAHKNTKGAGDARPTALQIIKDNDRENNMKDKVFLVTGTSSGLGIPTVEALAATGGKVYCAARDEKKNREVLKDILQHGRVEHITMDLGSLESVRAGANEFLSKESKLNVLVCNAGVMATPYGKTVDGFETQFGTNHLGHFLLFELVKDALLAGSTPDFNSRVVCVSSSGHRGAPVQFGDYNWEKAEYSPWGGYGQAKTSNIYMANEIERRYGSKGIHGFSLMPGGIMTGLQIHVPESMLKTWDTEDVRNFMKSPEQGAATQVWAAVGKLWEGKGAKYLEDCAEAGPVDEGTNVPGGPGYAKWAFNEEGERRLWEDSMKMVGLA
ncbi:hypothetical protein LTS18_010829 [Coniosporium uncinatum]|uniref:Uncharacterized protein n=1 Tax=Coniosporium uncinatum TaxID=93489 RepID=A0ACC3DKL5_9PEZI|nr:hypothetical protein LTS18_010829 [Coniosporium uncinatum]